MKRNKIGRNESCPCGSGLKYKKCCLSNGANTSFMISEKESNKRLKKILEEDYGHEITLQKNQDSTKMSEVILDLAGDFLSNAESYNEEQNIIGLTCLAWNLAVAFPDKHHQSEIDNFLSKLDLNSDKNLLQEFVNIVIKRIQTHYSHINRFIVHYDVSKNPDGLFLNIASSPLNVQEFEEFAT